MPPPAHPDLATEELRRFLSGEHCRIQDMLGARVRQPGEAGVEFAVWAPSATEVSVVGDWNQWSAGETALSLVGESGVWAGGSDRAAEGDRYKYLVRPRGGGEAVAKADPVGFRCETPPATASVVHDLSYSWGDAEWMAGRGARGGPDAPVSIYEVHLGSWRRGEGGAWLGYREIAPLLADHVTRLGFTHVELMPVMEHPFYGSWGYQITGYFAATSRYGEPQDLMALIDHLHQRGIGVLLDWVPGHFPTDEHGLGRFDGTALYEHPDPRRGFHPDWTSHIFDFGRPEVASFLVSSALFWLERYHADGLRVDGVASMLYLDYSRGEGEWLPNEDGGNENLEAVALLRRLNGTVSRECEGVETYAEESTAWPMVSGPVAEGGLGFGYKWDMGWMHDTLGYLRRDPVQRRHHHNELTFRAMYAWSERFALPLSHDEVVHGKGSLYGKMPGDQWQRRANLRLLLGWMFAQPGKKLLFMGGELGGEREWDHDGALEWALADAPGGAGTGRWLTALNELYRREAALHRLDHDPRGFEWIEADDAAHSTLAFLRLGGEGDPPLAAVFNFMPVRREGHRLGVPLGGPWVVELDSDAEEFGGAGGTGRSALVAEEVPSHDRAWSLTFDLPPLACVILRAGEA